MGTAASGNKIEWEVIGMNHGAECRMKFQQGVRKTGRGDQEGSSGEGVEGLCTRD